MTIKYSPLVWVLAIFVFTCPHLGRADSIKPAFEITVTLRPDICLEDRAVSRWARFDDEWVLKIDSPHPDLRFESRKKNEAFSTPHSLTIITQGEPFGVSVFDEDSGIFGKNDELISKTVISRYEAGINWLFKTSQGNPSQCLSVSVRDIDESEWLRYQSEPMTYDQLRDDPDWMTIAERCHGFTLWSPEREIQEQFDQAIHLSHYYLNLYQEQIKNHAPKKELEVTELHLYVKLEKAFGYVTGKRWAELVKYLENPRRYLWASNKDDYLLCRRNYELAYDQIQKNIPIFQALYQNYRKVFKSAPYPDWE